MSGERERERERERKAISSAAAKREEKWMLQKFLSPSEKNRFQARGTSATWAVRRYVPTSYIWVQTFKVLYFLFIDHSGQFCFIISWLYERQCHEYVKWAHVVLRVTQTFATSLISIHQKSWMSWILKFNISWSRHNLVARRACSEAPRAARPRSLP